MDDPRTAAAELRAAAETSLESAKATGRQLAAELPRQAALHTVAVLGTDGSSTPPPESDLAANLMARCIELAVTAVVGYTRAGLLELEADMNDRLAESDFKRGMSDRRRLVMERADATRKAAANGNWELFDYLAAGGDPNGPDRPGGPSPESEGGADEAGSPDGAAVGSTEHGG